MRLLTKVCFVAMNDLVLSLSKSHDNLGTKPRPFFKPRHQQRTHHHHQPKQQSLSHLSPATTKAEDDDDLFGGKVGVSFPKGFFIFLGNLYCLL